MRHFFILSMTTFFLFACTSAEQKPEKRWEVKVSRQSDSSVWVWRHDGSKQCDTPAQITPESASQSLKRQGIVVFQSQKGSDGRMYPSVCGAGTGSTVELQISRADLVKAQHMGFQLKDTEN
jgi:hypothetical protein